MFTEDVDDLFALNDFAEAVTIDGSSVVGIFEDAVDEGFEDVEATRPTFTAPASRLSAVSRGSTLVRGADTFRVLIKRPDGTGLVAYLELERQ